jgi:predicted outer membrane protein
LFSILVTIVLTLGLIVCILAKVPFIRGAFERHLNIWHNGVYIVNVSKYISYFSLHRFPDDTNAVNDKMFGQLSRQEIAAAKRALATSKSAEHKEFNLDIAKLLFVPSP